MESQHAVTPIVYADQKLKKVMVIPQEQSGVVDPDGLVFENAIGSVLDVPVYLQGSMTVVDVKTLAPGSYHLRLDGVEGASIKVVLF
ncbi:MAG: hypothetical protein WEC59_11915 [Salibacteraceae bacterium]